MPNITEMLTSIQSKHFGGDEDSMKDVSSVCPALEYASDLDKAKLALALLESISVPYDTVVGSFISLSTIGLRSAISRKIT